MLAAKLYPKEDVGIATTLLSRFDPIFDKFPSNPLNGIGIIWRETFIYSLPINNRIKMITRDTWIEVIRDFQERGLPELVERELEVDLKLPINRATIIMGPRRCGKTYYCFQLIKKLRRKNRYPLYVNLEDNRLSGATVGDLEQMLAIYYEMYPSEKEFYVFLDEVQNVPHWEGFVRRLLDDNVRVFITGSSSKLLSKEIASAMRGRSLSYIMLPFSFTEYLASKGIKVRRYMSLKEKSRLLNMLHEYLEWGGYPECILYPKGREKILKEIIDITIFRDVVERYGVKNIRVLRLLINALINSPEFSIHRFYNFLKSMGVKISKNTLYTYSECLEDIFFVFFLRRFSTSYREIEQTRPKVYLVDNGLLRINGISETRLLENLVFLELYRRCESTKKLFYYKTSDGKEVDFVICGEGVKQLIQVCYDISDYKTKERELKSLVRAAKELNCNNLLVITWDYEAKEEFKGREIKFTPLWRWLLKDDRKN